MSVEFTCKLSTALYWVVTELSIGLAIRSIYVPVVATRVYASESTCEHKSHVQKHGGTECNCSGFIG